MKEKTVQNLVTQLMILAQLLPKDSTLEPLALAAHEAEDVYETEYTRDFVGNTKTDYLDIFYFREQEQSFLREKILCKPEGIRFVVDQLNLTMHIIENIVMPKLIVVKNKESWAYFGKLYEEKGWVWMGYRFQHIQNMACGELCRITGLIDSQERIAPEIKETGLCGTFVLFTKHINQFTTAEERPKPALLKTILDWYDAEKAVRSFSI